eukprot:5078038-Pleurochrysis_carterae.AAC.1
MQPVLYLFASLGIFFIGSRKVRSCFAPHGTSAVLAHYLFGFSAFRYTEKERNVVEHQSAEQSNTIRGVSASCRKT